MIKLNIIPSVKEIKIKNKTIKIPKLGLKHYRMLKEVKGYDKNLNELMDSICPNMTAAEADMVFVHLMAHNGKIKEKQMFDDFELDINKTYFCNKTEFTCLGRTFYFKEPTLTQKFESSLDVLNKQFIKCEPHLDFDFEDMPAYAQDWADEILKTVAIDTPLGPVYGGINIVGQV